MVFLVTLLVTTIIIHYDLMYSYSLDLYVDFISKIYCRLTDRVGVLSHQYLVAARGRHQHHQPSPMAISQLVTVTKASMAQLPLVASWVQTSTPTSNQCHKVGPNSLLLSPPPSLPIRNNHTEPNTLKALDLIDKTQVTPQT